MTLHSDGTVSIDAQGDITVKTDTGTLSLQGQQVQIKGQTGVTVDGKPVQLVVMPVKAPITIGWVVMGFAVDARLVADMKALSELDTTVLTRAADGRWKAIETTFPGKALDAMLEDLKALPVNQVRPFDLGVAGSRFSARNQAR